MSKSTMMTTMIAVTHVPPARPPVTALVARALGAASRLLDRLATRLEARAPRQAAIAHGPVLEFYASAGAPEGALYLNGELVARLEGITRL